MTEEQRAYHHEAYFWYRAHGICYSCHHEDAVIAGLCGKCYYLTNERAHAYRQKNREVLNAKGNEYRAKKRAAGLCVSCGMRPAEPGRKYCEKCLAKDRRRGFIKRAEKRISRPPNQCKLCEKDRVPGYCYCPEHLERKRESAARMRERSHQKETNLDRRGAT